MQDETDKETRRSARPRGRGGDLKLQYPVDIRPEGTRLSVSFPDVPGVKASGDTIAGAINAGRAALREAFRAYCHFEKAFPLPSKPRAGQHLIFLPAIESAAILQHNEAIETRK